MTFERLDPQPGAREAGLPDDEAAPGLYPGEVALRLSGGPLVALSVEHPWLETGEGLSIRACARWIARDGRTRLTALGQHVETNASWTASNVDVAAWGKAPLVREVALLALGEPPQLMREVPEAEGPPSGRPVVDVAEDVRLSWSIRNAVKLVGGAAPAADVAALLGLG